MIRILSDDDYLYLIEGTQVEGIEDEFSWRLARSYLILLSNSSRQLLEIRLLKLLVQVFFPCGFYLYIHSLKYKMIGASRQRFDNALHL